MKIQPILPKISLKLLLYLNLFLIFQLSQSNLIAQTNSFNVSDFDPNKNQVLAFPGAEGFGRYASGGRGGQVIKVTNLNDSGPGSLREALISRGPRIIVFEVSGNIQLQSPIVLGLANSNLTVAGQTAPGEGITIGQHRITLNNTKNIIFRFIRFRPGDVSGEENQAGFGMYMENAIFDHCTFSWATDEIATFYAVKNFTLQWCIISEALNNSVHSKGTHGYGAIAGGRNVSWHHNLFAHATQRMIMLDHPGLYKNNSSIIQEWRGITDIRNNVIYNWETRSTSGGAEGNFNLVNNYYKPGPATSSFASNFILNPLNESGRYSYGKFFLSGNFLFGNSSVSSNNWLGARLENTELTEKFLENTKLNNPLPSNVYEYNHTAQEAYQKTLDFAGPSLLRDAVDNRIVNETRNGTFTFTGSKGSKFGIIDSQKDVGGWPTLKNLPAPKDSDGDGIPDSWETANGLDPNKVNDKENNLSPYYTDIEVYLNSLVQELLNKKNPGSPKGVDLLLPTNNTTISPLDISFAWQAISNAQSYQLQISKSSNFSSNVITINNIRNYSLVHASLDANSTYYWRVRASNLSGNGPYSEMGTFKTGSLNTVPGRTILTYPGNGNENISLTPIFNWAKVPNAKTYQIQVSTNSSFTSSIINQNNIIETKYQSPKLQENQLYYWRVRASNDSGNGSYTSVGTFRTLSLDNQPEPVIAIRPSNVANINPIQIRLDWVESPSAEKYQVEVSANAEFTDLILRNSDVQENLFLIPNLNPNTTYYWRVRGINRSGFGSFSTVLSFVTTGFSQVPNAIQIISPAHDSNVFSNSIQFEWAAEPKTISYRFQLSTSSDFNSLVTNVSGLTGTSRTVGNLSSNQDYYWRVQGINEMGTGAFSKIHKVRSATYSGRPPATTLVSPTNQAVLGASQILFTWENQPNTESYRLDISEKSDFSTISVRKNSIKGTSITVDELQANKTYYWRIQPYNPAGLGPISDIWSIKTTNLDINLNPPVLFLPQNASNFSNSNITFSWEAKEDADDYQLQISEKVDFSNLVFQNQSIKNNNFNLNSLTGGKGYFWRVRARNSTVYSAWSNPNSFSIGNPDLLLRIGLVGYWPMEEDGGNRMMDQSGNNLNATIKDVRNVTWVSGKEGKAIRLDGNSGRFGVIPHQPILNIGNTITLAAWVKPSVLNRGNIFYKNAGNGFELWLDIDGQIEFRLNRGNNGTTYRMRSSFNYKDRLNQWFHVAATFDGRTMTLFVNGQEDNTATYVPFEIGTSSGDLTLGAMETTQRWTGDLDELRIYNRALSKNEILLLMGQIPDTNPILSDPPIIPPSGNMIGYWKMDEGIGNQMLDHSGNNFHSYIQNTSGVNWTNGVIGQAISLNGFSNRFGISPHHPKLSIPNAISITAWVNPAELGRGTIISKSNGNGFELWLDIDGQIEFRLNRGNNGATYRLRSNFNYSNQIGNWIHVSATFDGTTSKIYINGQEDIVQTYPPFTIGTNSGDLVIGALGTIQRFQGSMDELRLYDFALSSAEIQALMGDNIDLNSPPIQDSLNDLVGHWKMDEGSGNIMEDHSGYGNNATILNTAGVSWTAGVIGQSISLNGNGDRFGIAAHHPSLEIPKELTISAWVKPDVMGRSTIISKSDGNGFELWMDINGEIEFRLNRGNNGFNYRIRSKFNYSNQIGNWIHVAATFDGTTSKIYINGQENIAQTYAPFTIGTKSGNLVIGALGTIQRFNGSIDDLRLYRSALNSNEIQQLASNQLMRTNEGSSKASLGLLQEELTQSKTTGSLQVSEEKTIPILYPNPIESLVKVKSLWQHDGEIIVQIFDMKGGLLMEQVMEVNGFQIELDLNSLRLKPGNYLLILQDAQHRDILRFIKK